MKERLRLSVDQYDVFIKALSARDTDVDVELVFEHREFSRENMEMFIPTEGVKSDAQLGGPVLQSLEKSL